MKLRAAALIAALACASAAAQDTPQALIGQAERHLDAARPVDALRALRRAQQLAEAARSDELNAAALAGLGELYVTVADFGRAQSSFDASLALAERAGAADPAARALNGLARLHLLGTRYARARELLDKAGARDGAGRSTTIATLLLRSELSARSGNLAEARSLAARASESAGAEGELAQARARVQLAAVAARAASYRDAIDGLEQAMQAFSRLGAVRDTADALLATGDLYLQFGQLEQAKPRYEEALRHFRSLGNGAGEARARVRLARCERRLLRADLAVAHADGALELARKRHDYVSEAEALVELAEIWIGAPVPSMPALPNPDVAQRYLRQAREIYRDAGDRAASAYVWLRSGAISLAAGQHVVATRAFEFIVGEARALQDEDLLWQGLRGLGAALAGRGELEPAARHYVEALDSLERVYERTAGLSQETRSSFLGDRRTIFEEYVELLILRRRRGGGSELDAAAFVASERAKSRQFTEMVAAAGAERAGSADPALAALLSRERALRVDLAQISAALAGPGGRDAGAAALAARAATLRAEHDGLMQRLDREFPAFADLLRPRALDAAELRRLLRPREAVVSYFVGARFTAAFVLTAEGFEMVPIEVPRTELRAAAEGFRRIFTDLSSFGDLERWSPADAHALYIRAFAPLAALLPAGTSLYIAADDVLYTVPFEAFLRAAPAAGAAPPMAARAPRAEQRTLTLAKAPPPAAPSAAPPVSFGGLATLDWLGDRYPITYVPSAGALRALRSQRKSTAWTRALVAFADPDFGEGPTGSAARLAGRSGTLARLPETADEVQAVSRILGGQSAIYLRRDASEAQVRSAELQGARYLMFSTHGLLGGEVSAIAEPSLAMTQVGNPAGLDGFVTMSEVLGLRLAADLVVLSACNTAGEPDAARIGEGFAGLTRSFMYAGARSLVVSHWPVASHATVALMTAFFEELKAGRAKPAALAAARKRLRGMVQDGIPLAHPYFWAPFVLVGEAD